MAEANRDEALRCLQLSQRLFAENELELSLKYAEKSTRLFASSDAEKWLAAVRTRLQSRGPRQGAAGASRAFCPTNDRTGPTEGKADGAHATGIFTKEQVEQVKSFMRVNKEDYYAVLGLKRGCDEAEIKKAYRKLALQFHPDKNQAPGADEAFKIISRAFSCLGDPEKRAQYDRFGADESVGGTGRGGFGGSTGVRFRSGAGGAYEVSPEELFNMFFGGMDGPFVRFGGSPSGMGGFRFSTSPFASDFMSQFAAAAAAAGGPRRRPNQPPEPPPNLFTLLIQFVPMLVLAIVMYLASFTPARADTFSGRSAPLNWESVSPHLSFSSSALHVNGPFLTDRLRIPYYSTHRFERFVGGQDRRPYEGMLERVRVQELQRDCQNQQRHLQTRRAEAASRGDSATLEALQRETCEACESLHRLGVQSPPNI